MKQIKLEDTNSNNKLGLLDKKSFNIMVFPSGPLCNLNCGYCYYLDKINYYKDTISFKMGYEVLEEFTRQYIEAQPEPVVSFGWQGGEPTLRGLDFFRKAVELQKKYLPADWELQNNFQTNAVLLDDNWCQFFKKNNFLVGVSLDGPTWLHNKYRRDKQGNSTHERVIEGIRLLQKYRVDFNILCVVHEKNSKYPLEVYNHFKEIGVDFIQFIPLVEKSKEGTIRESSVKPEDFGHFLITIFDEWLKKDYGSIFIQVFEEAVRRWAGYGPGLCIFSKTCGKAVVLEHNGDLYSCDHFVYPEHKLGNIKNTSITEMINSIQQHEFGSQKFRSLPGKCLECEVAFICQGGCPKNRIYNTSEEGLNYLCSGYKMFFKYIDPYMKKIVKGIKYKQSPGTIQRELIKFHDEVWDIGRNTSCPCGSGKKYKKCCLNRK